MAAITSWATLKTAVGDWIHRDDLASSIPDFIQFGEARIYRDLRVRAMETALSAAISSGTLALPTGYIELKYAYINSTPVQWLTRKDAEWIYANYPTRSSDSSPKYIAREGESFIFGPYPDSGYTVKGIYYKKLAALSGTNETNWLVTDVPDLILFASLCEAAPWMENDARIPIWEKKYEQIRQRVQRNDENEEFSGSILAATVR